MMNSFMLIVVMGFKSGYAGWGGVDTQVFQSYEACESARQQVVTAIRESNGGRPRAFESSSELVARCVPIKE